MCNGVFKPAMFNITEYQRKEYPTDIAGYQRKEKWIILAMPLRQGTRGLAGQMTTVRMVPLSLYPDMSTH
jgi:hypothetical protein